MTPSPATPSPSTSGTAVALLGPKIKEARAAGYSDDDIVSHLSAAHPDLAPQIKTARDSGYSSTEINKHLSNLAQSRLANIQSIIDARNATQPQGSALERFGKGLWNTTIGAVPGMLQTIGSVPLSVVPGETGRAARDTLNRNVVQPQLQQFRDIRNMGHVSMSDVPEIAGHALAGVLPLAGPMVANIGEQFGSGDIAGGLGSVGGLAATYTAPHWIPPVVKGAASLAKPALKVAGEAIPFAMHPKTSIIRAVAEGIKKATTTTEPETTGYAGQKTWKSLPLPGVTKEVGTQPPPLQGSSLPPVVKGTPPPPLQGSSLPPDTVPVKPVPPPPLQGSSIGPTKPTPKQAIPPIRWNPTQGPPELPGGTPEPIQPVVPKPAPNIPVRGPGGKFMKRPLGSERGSLAIGPIVDDISEFLKNPSARWWLGPKGQAVNIEDSGLSTHQKVAGNMMGGPPKSSMADMKSKGWVQVEEDGINSSRKALETPQYTTAISGLAQHLSRTPGYKNLYITVDEGLPTEAEATVPFSEVGDFLSKPDRYLKASKIKPVKPTRP